jgi:hypothetical protein
MSAGRSNPMAAETAFPPIRNEQRNGEISAVAIVLVSRSASREPEARVL